MQPPVAEKIPYRSSHHGIEIVDPYHWLKDPGYPEVNEPHVLAYLKAENDYFDYRMAPHQPLIDQLFAEIKGRQPAQDESVPYRKGNFWYRWRYEEGAQYRLWLRASVDDPENWRVILDEPALAAEHDYFALGGMAISANGRYLAWSADTNGSERFTLSIQDLRQDVPLDEPIELTLDSPVWAGDNQHLFYLRLNENWRPYRVMRHRMGRPVQEDVVVYEEEDEAFFVGIDLTQSADFILVTTGDHVTSEVRLLLSSAPTSPMQLICPRRSGHEYDVDHAAGYFYIRSNDQHKNFRLAKTPADTPAPEHWETLIAGSDDHYLTGHLCFKDWILIMQRVAGLEQLRVIPTAQADESHFIAFPEAAYSIDFGTNAEYAANTLRLTYQSMVTPTTVFDYDLRSRELISRKIQEIPSGYDAQNYVTERHLAPARDGAEVPVSLVYRKGLARDGHTPLYLYGYGAYGLSISPGFSPSRLSLLDRGFVFAIAHVRGGDDLGYQWYEDGKLEKRQNTFNDFIDVARYLIDQQYTSADRLAISGSSAGGELIAAVINQAPQLFGVAAAHVPFVDVLNTMLDGDLPLTPIEWPEWGNPIEDQAAFERLRAYSPYDQLKRREYPPMLVTAGLHDPRVTYWEPAKYVARMRTLKMDDHWLLLKTNMSTGHRGPSGRFEALQELAEEYAFMLVSLGLEDVG